MSQNPPERNKGYQFTPEEMRVLRECTRESFYYRSVPIGIVLASASHVAVKMGYLKGNAKYGSAPKMFLSTIIGYFVGKLSYTGVCADKFAALPNSPLGEAIRQKQKGLSYEMPQPNTSFEGETKQFDSNTNERESEKVLLDDTNSNDYFTPSNDEGKIITYDDMRRKNREKFDQAKTAEYPKPTQSSYSYPLPVKSKPKTDGKVNQYGDSWDD